MRVQRRLSALVTVAAAVATAAVVTAAPATAGGGAGVMVSYPIPADCTLTAIDANSRSLTCTARPAGQRWRLLMAWENNWGIGGLDHQPGSIVTGDGTSYADTYAQTHAVDMYHRFEIL